MEPSDRHESTIAFAELALKQIKALHLPAEPQDYEVWYNYTTGYNPSLNKAINDTLASKGALASADIDAIHTNYFGGKASAGIDKVGAQVADEIHQVMAMIEQAVGTASNYSESLADMTQQLVQPIDREGLRAIVESLVETTRDAERSNHALEQKLKASKREIEELQVNLATIRHESLTDPLTTLANRKSFDEAITKAIADATAGGGQMALVMIDIDHFKSFNDTYGHLTGDQVLRLVAQCVKQNVKGQDTAARYGGEEFGVILPNTSLSDAMKVAEHIRAAVMSKELIKRSTGENLGRVTVSMGIAACAARDSTQSLIERADACLYAAKRAGRNRVIGENDPLAAPAPQHRVA